MAKPGLKYKDLLLARLAVAEYLLDHRGENSEDRKDMEALLKYLGYLVDRVYSKKKTTVTITFE